MRRRFVLAIKGFEERSGRFRYLPAYLPCWRGRFVGQIAFATNLKGDHRPQNRPHEKGRPLKADAILLNSKIGARGFEPPTPWSRTRCSSQAEPRPERKAQSF